MSKADSSFSFIFNLLRAECLTEEKDSGPDGLSQTKCSAAALKLGWTRRDG
jgi:hypothetical protein